MFKVSVNDLFLNEGDDPAAVTQAMFQEDTIIPMDTIDSKGIKSRRRVNISAMLRKEEQVARISERRFMAAITRHFSEQQKAVEAAIGLTSKADTPSFLSPLADYLLDDGTFDPEKWAALTEAEQVKLSEGIAAGLLNWDAEVKKLTKLFTPIWKAAYEDGEIVSAEAYGITEIQRPEFVSAAKVNGAKRIVGIQQTTRDGIANVIAKGVESGQSQREIQKAVLSEMSTTQTRAKLIARQETMTALATGQFDMMKASGATTKTWHHRNQIDPRDGTHGKVNHVILEGETVNIDDTFSNGLRYPRDPEDGRPEQLINCRCYLTYGGF